uniref:hypothetical protein n=1 Tax=Treponema sp. TaxID=166 RepID=UPI00298EA72B
MAAGYKIFQRDNGNCCFARACLIAKELRDYGFDVSYVYCDPIEFDYHVAVCVTIENERYIVDPSLSKKQCVYKYTEWISKQKIRGNNPKPRKTQLINNSYENFNIALEYKNYLKRTGKSDKEISIYEFS